MNPEWILADVTNFIKLGCGPCGYSNGSICYLSGPERETYQKLRCSGIWLNHKDGYSFNEALAISLYTQYSYMS